MSSRLPNDAISTPLDQLAIDVITDYSTSLAETIVFQTKLLAYRQRASRALSIHAEEAIDIITKRQKRNKLNDFIVLLGGALVGAFIPGLIGATINQAYRDAVIYAVVGAVGIGITMFGLLRD